MDGGRKRPRLLDGTALPQSTVNIGSVQAGTHRGAMEQHHPVTVQDYILAYPVACLYDLLMASVNVEHAAIH